MQRVLVTGASGFIGQRLLELLPKTEYEVIAVGSQDGDIAAPSYFDSLAKADHVIHLAGRTFVPDAWREPADFQRVNLGGTVNVLEYCRKNSARLTYVSAYLYGVPSMLPVHESQELKPNNPYALSKSMAETACRFYADYYEIPITILRPFNIYGPGQKSHFLIPEIINQILRKQPIHVKDLSPRRDYLYIDDLVDALILTIRSHSGLRIYNVGYGSSMSVAEIVAEIQTVAGTDLPVTSENLPRRNEIADVYADIDAIKSDLAWLPKYDFRTGISALLAHAGKLSEEINHE